MRDAGGYCLSPASAEAQDSCPKRRWHVIYAHIFLFALSRTSPYVFFISDDCPFRDPRCLLYVQREAGVLRLLLGPSNDASSPRGRTRRRLIPARRLVLLLEDDAAPCSHAVRRGIASFPHGETHGTSRWQAVRVPISCWIGTYCPHRTVQFETENLD
ncbi:hypothetical protein BHM03_00035385 [Ensete ventricosum]|nr:hypothetical protein BHM03_00035385 [Ensete ventricosum]